MWTIRNDLFRAGLVVLLLVLIPSWGQAETIVTPSVNLRTTYDDNIRFSVDKPLSDLISSLEGGLDASYRTERFQSKSTMSVRALKYLQESDLDREEAHIGTSLSHAWTERLSANGNASYMLDSALDTELEETGLIVEQDNRQRISAGGGLSYRITELQELACSFSLGRTAYDSEQRVDYNTSNITLTWYRASKNQRDGLTVQSYWNAQSSDVSEVETYGLMFGWTRQLTENWSLNAFLGARRTQTEYSHLQQEVVFDPTLLPAVSYRIEEETVTEEEASWGGVADVSVDWIGETWSFRSSYNRDLSYSSLGEPIERDQLGIVVNKKFNVRWSARCGGTMTLSQYERQTKDESYRKLSLSPSLSYRLTKDHRLSAGFYYDYYENELSEDSGRDRKRIWISLDCSFPQVW
jgi:hypothetical protein